MGIEQAFLPLALSFGTGLLGGVLKGRLRRDEEEKQLLTESAVRNPGLFQIPEYNKALGRFFSKDSINALSQFAKLNAQKEQAMQDLLLGTGGQPGAPGQPEAPTQPATSHPGGQTTSELPPGMSLSGKVGGLTVRRSGLEPPGLGPDVNSQLRALGFDPRTASPDQIRQALQARNASQASLTGAQERARLGAQLSPEAISGQAAKAGAVSSAKARALLARDIQAAQASQAGAVAGSQESGRLGVQGSPAGLATTANRAAAQALGTAQGSAQAVGLPLGGGQTIGDVQAAQIARETAARQGAQPVSADVQDRLGNLFSVQRRLQEIAATFDPAFVGPVRGRTAGIREEVPGAMDTPEARFRAALSDVKDQLLRSRSGAQINEQEFKRLTAILPDEKAQPRIFQAKLKSFRTEFAAILQDKIRLATQSRASLSPSQGQILGGQPAGQPVSVQPPALPAGISKASDAVRFYQQQGFSEDQSKQIVKGLLQGGQ